MSNHSQTELIITKLPDEIIYEILSRIPVKSLLKFLSVSKSWNSMISSRVFSKSHLMNSRKYSHEHQVMMFDCYGNVKHCSTSSLLHDPLVLGKSAHCPFQLSRKVVRVVGSCGGLICLAKDRKGFILWNPTTNKNIQLPDFGVKMSYAISVAYGLGYDKRSDDYKVVALTSNKETCEVTVKVCSVKTGEWVSTKNFKGRWVMDEPATFMNGKLYWSVNLGSEFMSRWHIAFFDLERDECGVLQMPNQVEGGYLRLGAYDEGRSLHVFCSHLTHGDMWIMESCESRQETWTVVAKVPYIDNFLRYADKKLMYVGKDGEILLLCQSKFVVFDTKDCSFRYPDVRASVDVVAATTYVESLVSPIM